MRTSGWEERLRELDEAGMVFKVARRVSLWGYGGHGNIEGNVQTSPEGWLRTVRRAVGIPVAEASARMGIVESDFYRMEVAEGRGAIELQTLRRAAEALGCELVYGLAPKAGTLTEMAAAIDASRAQRRTEAKALKLEKARDQRYEKTKKLWEKQERKRPGTGSPFWRERMRKALRRSLRQEGIRLR